MVTALSFLRLSLCALMILSTHGLPIKGSKSQHESSGGTHHGGHSGSHKGGANGRHTPKIHVSRPAPIVGQVPSLSQFVPTDSASDSMSSNLQAGYPVGAGFVPVGYPIGNVPAGFDASSSQSNPLGGGIYCHVFKLYSASGGVSSMPAAGYPGGAVFMPVPLGYAGSSQPEAAQSGPPETKWSVAPKIFSEEGLANTEAVSSSDGLPAAPPAPPSGPVLQSGETSNVVKEAELGNYQHETEEIGYPAERMGPGQGFPSYPVASPFMPVVGGFGGYPGLYPYPYPVFDYRLLYGLYPPGTYTTFSKNHEKGKDYYQNIHYLKEHGPGGSDVPNTPGSSGSGQQKVFQ